MSYSVIYFDIQNWLKNCRKFFDHMPKWTVKLQMYILHEINKIKKFGYDIFSVTSYQNDFDKKRVRHIFFMGMNFRNFAKNSTNLRERFFP